MYSLRVGNDTDDSTPAEKYYTEDQLGSCSVAYKSNAQLINLEEFYPFGETSFGSYSKKRYRYCGKQKDEESGYYNYGQRYYAPWLCRFISVDPLAGKYAQLTPYNYAGNKPISSKDIEGLRGDKNPKSKQSLKHGKNNLSHQSYAGQYTIKAGDTFWSLENKMHLTHGTLHKLNPTLDEHNLQIGSTIRTNPQQHTTNRSNNSSWHPPMKLSENSGVTQVNDSKKKSNSDIVTHHYSIDDILAFYDKPSSSNYMYLSESQTKINTFVIAIQWFLPTGDRFQISSTFSTAYNEYKNFERKPISSKLPEYLKTLTEINKDLTNRISNEFKSMIKISNIMESYKETKDTNTISYKILDQKWKIERDKLFDLQDQQRVVKHEINFVNSYLKEHPIIYH